MSKESDSQTHEAKVTCTHAKCQRSVVVRWKKGDFVSPNDSSHGRQIFFGVCPGCDDLLVWMVEGWFSDGSFTRVDKYSAIWPLPRPKVLTAPEVPEKLRIDFNEAQAVLTISRKASAAISRRILQNVLRDHFNIVERDLSKEIERFIHLPGVPNHLAQSVDAIRNVGNFAAHPLKDTSTGEVVEVEPGEPEWLLETLEQLFDFTFIQPSLLEDRRKKLNAKLQGLGKPPLK